MLIAVFGSFATTDLLWHTVRDFYDITRTCPFILTNVAAMSRSPTHHWSIHVCGYKHNSHIGWGDWSLSTEYLQWLKWLSPFRIADQSHMLATWLYIAHKSTSHNKVLFVNIICFKVCFVYVWWNIVTSAIWTKYEVCGWDANKVWCEVLYVHLGCAAIKAI